MRLDKKSAKNELVVIPMVVQCKEDALQLAVYKQAVLEPGLGKLTMMGNKLVPGMYPKDQLLESLQGKDGSSVMVLDKCVQQNKMAVPEAESHFQYHPLAATDLHELQTLAEYNPAEHFSVVMP